MSVTPVRIALRELVTEGLVEMRPHGGARVSPLSIEAVESLYAARIGFESLLARRGAPALTDADLERMNERREQVEHAADENSVDAFLLAAWEHRRCCYRAAHRSRLLEESQVLYRRSGRYNGLSMMTATRLRESVDTVRRFHAACESRSGVAAESTVREALMRTLDHLIGAFPVDDGDV